MPDDHWAHPYMANMGDDAKKMLTEVGLESVAELFAIIPPEHRLRRPLTLPEPLRSEAELRRETIGLLNKNESCDGALNFLGAGCYHHHVPAVCDAVVERTEWLTSVWGTPSSDYGRFQAWFEYASLLGELLALDFVGLPVYSYGCAAGHALRMAARMTGRRRVLLPRLLDPERRAVIRNYLGAPELGEYLEASDVAYRAEDGRIDLEDLERQLNRDVSAVYLESPNFLGVIEDGVEQVVALARRAGAEVVMGVDPISLGVLAAPGELGVGLAVGTLQTLGCHLNAGGGLGGFIASRDEERYTRQYPTLQVSLCETTVPGERGFGIALFGQTSYGAREQANDWTGNSVYLWAIAAAAYMALMGPAGFAELGRTVLQRTAHAVDRLRQIPGVSVRWRDGVFREFVVEFAGTGKSVADVNEQLLMRRIFGGFDLSGSYPEFGQSALYCITELHCKEDIDRLASALEEIIP